MELHGRCQHPSSGEIFDILEAGTFVIRGAHPPRLTALVRGRAGV